MLLKLAHHAVAVQAGHHHVRNHQVGYLGQGQGHPLQAVGGFEQAVAGRGQAGADELAHVLVVFDEEHHVGVGVQRLHVGVGGQAGGRADGHGGRLVVGHGGRGAGHQPLGQAHREGGALPGGAVHGHGAAVQLGQLAHQGQAHTGAGLGVGRGGVGALVKSVE